MKKTRKMKKIKVAMVRKPRNFEELVYYIRKYPEDLGDAVISETIELSPSMYEELVNTFCVGSFDYLKGKGGSTKDGEFITIEVKCKGYKTLYINPEGHDYARYVGLAA